MVQLRSEAAVRAAREYGIQLRSQDTGCTISWMAWAARDENRHLLGGMNETQFARLCNNDFAKWINTPPGEERLAAAKRMGGGTGGGAGGGAGGVAHVGDATMLAATAPPLRVNAASAAPVSAAAPPALRVNTAVFVTPPASLAVVIAVHGLEMNKTAPRATASIVCGPVQ